MRAKSIVFTLILCCVSALTIADTTDKTMGTWKLNESKSKLNPQMGKNHTVIYAMEGESVKITVDGVDGKGNPTHNEWTGKFDEKEYPVTGDPNSDMRSYKIVDDHTLHMIAKKGGKVAAEVHIVLSEDGKTRTVTVKPADSSQMTTTAVYDKQ